MKKKKTSRVTTILLFVVFFAGLSLLLYPTVSDYWNSLHQSRAIAAYAEDIANMDEDQYAEVLASAQEYNRSLLTRTNVYLLTDEQEAQYDRQLNTAGTGIMGYVEIPTINCALPIYHGTDETVLQIAVGHLEWTSLPVGGINSHCVLSGHRGLPSAKLFTDLDKLVEGDVFLLRVLDEVLTYEVDQILIVEPYEVEQLEIVPGQDLCTLVTCTPYGVNSHRLLVRGHRIETAAEARAAHVVADAIQIDPVIVAPAVALPILLILLIGLLAKPTKPKKR